jgi:hypothetical protein
VIVGGDVILIDAVPASVESCVEVAFMFATPELGGAAGAVYRPELEIVPESVNQATVEL